MKKFALLILFLFGMLSLDAAYDTKSQDKSKDNKSQEKLSTASSKCAQKWLSVVHVYRFINQLRKAGTELIETGDDKSLLDIVSGFKDLSPAAQGRFWIRIDRYNEKKEQWLLDVITVQKVGDTHLLGQRLDQWQKILSELCVQSADADDRIFAQLDSKMSTVIMRAWHLRSVKLIEGITERIKQFLHSSDSLDQSKAQSAQEYMKQFEKFVTDLDKMVSKAKQGNDSDSDVTTAMETMNIEIEKL